MNLQKIGFHLQPTSLQPDEHAKKGFQLKLTPLQSYEKRVSEGGTDRIKVEEVRDEAHSEIWSRRARG
jgi:hypothetical protein